MFEFANDLQKESGRWIYGFNEVNDIVQTLRSQLAHLMTDGLELRQKFLGAKLDPELMSLPAEPLRILLERPFAWEYRFFAAVLRSEMARWSQLRRDVKYSIQIGPVLSVGELEAFGWLTAQFDRVTALIESAGTLMNEVVQEALGPPGTPGDASLLLYVGRRLAAVVEGLLQWKIDLSMMKTPEHFHRVFRLTTEMPNESIAKLESIGPTLDSEIDKAEAAVARGEQYVADVMFVLSTPVTDEFKVEMQRLRIHYGLD